MLVSIVDPTVKQEDGAVYDRRIVIDPGAISSNVERIRRAVAPSELIVVVKADGYGHNAEISARAALDGGATHLGVADIKEGLALRAAGINAPILAWLHPVEADFEAAVAADIEIGVSSTFQLAAAVRAGAPSVQLKFDTGLSRNGVAPADADKLIATAAMWEHAGRLTVTGLFTHLSNASEAENERQLSLFDMLTIRARNAGLRPRVRHVGGSHSALAVDPGRYEMLRVGIVAFGIAPESRTPVADLGLRPAMRVMTTVAGVRDVPAGTGVSYDHTYRTPEHTRLALIPLGYADGVPRSASSAATVTINGKRHLIAGRVAMDQFVVDVGDEPVAVGDQVVLWGDPAEGEPSIEEWATACGTIPYELLTRVALNSSRMTIATSAVGAGVV